MTEKTENNNLNNKTAGNRTLKFLNRFAIVLHFAGSFVLYFLIEAMARHSISEAISFLDGSTKAFMYNVILIFLTSLPVFLFKRRAFWRTLIFGAWLFLGAANGFILANRVTPLTGPDFRMIREGAGIITKYMSGAMSVILFIVLGLLVLAMLFFFFKCPKYQGKRNFKLIVPLILAAVVGFYGLTQYCYNTKVLSTYFGNIAFAYQDYGFPYCLAVTITDTGIDKPQNYSEKLIKDIVKQEKDPDPGKTDDLPNIIMVQLESFFDPSGVKFLKFSEDPLPNWHKLSKKYTSGYYTVPTIGAGTVNTEFETLTGMSLRYFGAGEYPYKGVLKDKTCESIAYILEDYGLKAHAVHNNYATFYSRRTVYSHIGFSDFTSSEYMDNQDDINEIGWMRDRTLIPHIGDCLDSTEGKDFVFAVSVQGHGGYPTADLIEDPEIEVTGAGSAEANCQWEYYVNQLHEMDKFVKDLTEYIEERGEPTIILFYGDHLPTMGLENKDLKNRNIYKTNYIIWDNMGLKHKQKKNIFAYQAAAEVLNSIDVHVGEVFRFHQTCKKKKSYQLDLQTLQYDILYGDGYIYGGVEPYANKQMVMGIKPIVVSSVKKAGDDIYYVYGKNFTQSSRVLVD
ncbi:MAG: sulfatase-like hydrolase/transferase, partial [Firmicutes bacterium]|nr:sulfatase-like hydrolase/transferase [Bacillota bacterium]